MTKAKVLVTGSAGFIGMHTALRLAEKGFDVVGIDNLNTYYSVDLKLARLREQGIETNNIQYNRMLQGVEGIRFSQMDLADAYLIEELFEKECFDYVIHLAAQAGVRYSIENPHAYIDANVKGFLDILESCVKNDVKHLVYASSSSVYGLNKEVPFKETDQTETQVSLYAATKKANEAMAHSYACVHKLPVTGLRFFTVYGPFGRPDMALFKFTKRILANEPIDVYNNGDLSRDFTYVDDIVDGILSLVKKKPESEIPYGIYNIGRGEPVALDDFIKAIEKATGKTAKRNNLPMQPGDVLRTSADTTELGSYVGYSPVTSIEEGVENFVSWYKKYYKIH
ncbi:NAD-dependent epimerase/dehydratase family protein [Croceimicrobium hydrocarbonivorans]|uniref:NAD-dependent epimerase/dehydratase family protein n=1 Tax=Croceimicrobium hydrocarbonivorans TaxID=2761580 RepID=A0A7H0VGB7_9FLAO|nr:NAD-dependent epimerase/dehydratase family protein [Croceimicrobium hydrocarbonivorans]QNR24765.1 NAD-dependent epimerase/dehydratase family protein [Croceimicrobium hydrocarbonivorans]